MTREQIKAEFNRLVDAGKPKVWARSVDTEWYTTDFPAWQDNFSYIIEDKHAKLRKLQIDEPDIKFEMQKPNGDWMKWNNPKWNIDTEYRVKSKEWYEDPNMVGKPIWVRDDKNSDWEIAIFKGYSNENLCNFNTITDDVSWRYAKPVTWRDLYQGNSNDITK